MLKSLRGSLVLISLLGLIPLLYLISWRSVVASQTKAFGVIRNSSFHYERGELTFERWKLGLWGERAKESGTLNCKLRQTKVTPLDPLVPWTGCQAPIFSELDSQRCLHILKCDEEEVEI